MLTTINKEHFLKEIPKVPMGKYSHIVLLRETESFPVFQTDGGLNTVRVRAGLKPDSDVMTRLAIFKRKQSSPERLVGREILRRHGIVKEDQCDYNEKFCMHCPDCIYYGFAIGESGSEKSKVMVDTAFSITGYDESHQQLSFNALYEEGKMSREGKTRVSFGEQDHVLPQVFFPAVETIKDATEAEFIYVVNNILRTKRYGAQETRTGKVDNHIIAFIFADGDVFSNLKFTQYICDVLDDNDDLQTPIDPEKVRVAAVECASSLVKNDGVCYELIIGDDLQKALEEIDEIATDDAKLRELLAKAGAEAEAYAQKYILGE